MKLKLNTLTKGLIFVGIVTILFSIGWHIKYPDTSQLVLFVIQGILILGFAYLCEWTRKMKESHEELDDRISAMDNWVREEFKKRPK
ncbi:unnamed protein product [marine sediment metagenome]|uniref:Uncharacterized protein n=1 Tax=marine sediment metagenome TaxID=412755 RepID=X0SBB2_9ZZZZ